MKKNVLFKLLLFAIVLVAGCSKESVPNDNEFHLNWDYPHMFEGGPANAIAKSDDGYYFLTDMLLYFMDKDTKTAVVLDNRPNHSCHDELPQVQSCYAYVDLTNKEFIQFYNEHLYVIEQNVYGFNENDDFVKSWVLVRRDHDGSNRKEVFEFEIRPRSLGIHRGYIYYTLKGSGHSSGQLPSQLLRVPMKNLNQEPEILYEVSSDKLIERIVPYGNQIYMFLAKGNDFKTMRYDINDGSSKELWNRNDGSNTLFRTIVGDRLIFSYNYDFTADDERTRKTYSSDLYGKNITELSMELPITFSETFGDEQYIYNAPMSTYLRDLGLEDQDIIKIYKDGEKIHEVDRSIFSRANYISGSGDERFLFLRNWGTNENATDAFYILDKNEIESGEAQFELLIKNRLRPGIITKSDGTKIIAD